MIQRLTLVSVLCCALAAGLLPTSASAHGPVRRGIVVDAPSVRTGRTGNCACYNQWYTVGINAGTVKMSLHVTFCQQTLAPSCGVVAYLRDSSHDISNASTGCFTSKFRCDGGINLSYHAARPGVYYLLVKGEGANVIRYVLSVRGSLYPLHCSKYC